MQRIEKSVNESHETIKIAVDENLWNITEHLRKLGYKVLTYPPGTPKQRLKSLMNKDRVKFFVTRSFMDFGRKSYFVIQINFNRPDYMTADIVNHFISEHFDSDKNAHQGYVRIDNYYLDIYQFPHRGGKTGKKTKRGWRKIAVDESCLDIAQNLHAMGYETLICPKGASSSELHLQLNQERVDIFVTQNFRDFEGLKERRYYLLGIDVTRPAYMTVDIVEYFMEQLFETQKKISPRIFIINSKSLKDCNFPHQAKKDEATEDEI